MELLSSLEVTNTCAVLCDLQRWSEPDAPAWTAVRGNQDDVGAGLAALLEQRGLNRLDDFGGVAKTFLCAGEEYLEAPARTRPGAAVFSFTPRKRIIAEGLAMARVTRRSGYGALVLTVQKEGKFGKVWALGALLRHCRVPGLVYYEDTATIVDELKGPPEGERVTVLHVLAPGPGRAWRGPCSAARAHPGGRPRSHRAAAPGVHHSPVARRSAVRRPPSAFRRRSAA